MNKHRGEHEIELQGEKLKLRMTFNAMVELEEMAGAPATKIFQLLHQEKTGMSLQMLTAVIWAGYRGALPDDERRRARTFESIGEAIFLEGMVDVMKEATLFLSLAFTTEEQVEEVKSKLGKEQSEDENSED